MARATARIVMDFAAGATMTLRGLVEQLCADLLRDPYLETTEGEARLWAAGGEWTQIDEGSVQRYLAAHPWLAPVVVEARNEIARIFGSGAQVRLEVVRDEEGAEQLFAIVSSSLPPDAAYTALGRLDEEWLIDALTRGQFNVDLELSGGADGV